MRITTDACLFGAWVASKIAQEQEPKTILDIGTGTGLLSLILAQATTHATFDAIEANERAVLEAEKNFALSPWPDRLCVIPKPVQQHHTSPYDLIICNPPFFANSLKGKQEDKNEALHAEGLSMDDLVTCIGRLLNRNGTCYLLYPHREMTHFLSLSEKIGLVPKELVTVRNQEDAPIFRAMAALTGKSTKTEEAELIIRRKDKRYTDGFWSLLAPYYLDYNNPSNRVRTLR